MTSIKIMFFVVICCSFFSVGGCANKDDLLRREQQAGGRKMTLMRMEKIRKWNEELFYDMDYSQEFIDAYIDEKKALRKRVKAQYLKAKGLSPDDESKVRFIACGRTRYITDKFETILVKSWDPDGGIEVIVPDYGIPFWVCTRIMNSLADGNIKEARKWMTPEVKIVDTKPIDYSNGPLNIHHFTAEKETGELPSYDIRFYSNFTSPNEAWLNDDASFSFRVVKKNGLWLVDRAYLSDPDIVD